MTHYKIYAFLFAAFLFLNDSSLAATCTSIANGNWATAGTWSCGRKPGCGDTIYINHTVTLAASEDYFASCTDGCTTNSKMFITIGSAGTLHFTNGRKLKLPCCSGVTIDPGGQITADGYTGNSESLQICGAVAWQADDGLATGPLVYGSGLPIELISFEAYYYNKNVNIAWTTISETNNHYFLIQRSNDGVTWEDLIQTLGAGNSSSIINYLEVDYSPLIGTSYYRLKQVDYNGESSYSEMAVVKSYNQLATEFTLYPNPTDGSFHIQLSGFGDEEYLVVVRDLTGRETYSKVFITSTKNHIEAFDLNGKLAAGTYVITASNRNEFYSQKLVVK